MIIGLKYPKFQKISTPNEVNPRSGHPNHQQQNLVHRPHSFLPQAAKRSTDICPRQSHQPIHHHLGQRAQPIDRRRLDRAPKNSRVQIAGDRTHHHSVQILQQVRSPCRFAHVLYLYPPFSMPA